MSNEVAIYNASVPDRMRYAEALAQASLLPAAYRAKPANVLLALEYGAALGIAPMVAIQGIHVIEGKPTASAGLIGALVRKAGHRLRVTGDDKVARCEIVRGDDPDFTFVSEWTMARAQSAGLTGKQVWKNYPAAMLKARAITEAARDACPEALSGVNYTAEELGDDTPPSDSYPQTDTGADGAPAGASAPAERRLEPSAPVSDDDIVDAVIVEDDVPAWVPRVATATSRDELRRVWNEFASQLPANGRANLSRAMTVRAEELDAATDSDTGTGEAEDGLVASEPESEVPVSDTPSLDDSGPAKRSRLAQLSIALDDLGVKDRQDCLDYIGAVIGRVIKSRTELTDSEAIKATNQARRDHADTPTQASA